MKFLFAVLILYSANILSEELTYVCDDVNSNSDIPQSLVINQSKGYVIFLKDKLTITVNEETLIMSKKEGEWGTSLVEIDKVTGWLKYFTFGDFESSAVYKCTRTKRLIPWEYIKE